MEKNAMNREEIKAKILSHREILDRHSVKDIALFGSYARNEQERRSDIDFLIEFRKPTFRNYVGLLSDLKRLFHRKVDLVCIDALKQNLKPYILKEAQWLRKA